MQTQRAAIARSRLQPGGFLTIPSAIRQNLIEAGLSPFELRAIIEVHGKEMLIHFNRDEGRKLIFHHYSLVLKLPQSMLLEILRALNLDPLDFVSKRKKVYAVFYPVSAVTYHVVFEVEKT